MEIKSISPAQSSAECYTLCSIDHCWMVPAKTPLSSVLLMCSRWFDVS